MEVVKWYQAHAWALIPTVYAVMSIVTFIVYAMDKIAARRGAWRTPELTLHLLEFLCGWPGAWLAQKMLHHKCSKASYLFVFFVVVVLNLAALGYVLYLMFRRS